MQPTIGRVVLYKLAQYDIDAINADRAASAGAGNAPWKPGEEYPAVVVRVFGETEMGTCNLQVLLDGPDSYWATSRYNVDSDYVRIQQHNANLLEGIGCWRWPPRA